MRRQLWGALILDSRGFRMSTGFRASCWTDALAKAHYFAVSSGGRLIQLELQPYRGVWKWVEEGARRSVAMEKRVDDLESVVVALMRAMGERKRRYSFRRGAQILTVEVRKRKHQDFRYPPVVHVERRPRV